MREGVHSGVIVLEPGESLISDIRGCIFRADLNINAETWSPPPAQPDDAHCRHRHHHLHRHHHTPAHITSKKKERGCDQTQISQLSNTHTFRSAAERSAYELWQCFDSYLYREAATGKVLHLFDCFKGFQSNLKTLIPPFLGGFSKACACADTLHLYHHQTCWRRLQQTATSSL